jgi:hypothetical protein
MITSRYLEAGDKQMLADSLSQDAYHKDTTDADFFYDPRTVSSVFEDEQGPVCVIKGSPVLRFDIQFLNNKDFRRNRAALLRAFSHYLTTAKENGFTEFAFQSDSPLLIAFCKKHFGFVESSGELRKQL